MITLSQLRVFAAVARHRHFTRAAEELQIAQPSVSYQVRTLEHSLKVQLIEVVGRQVYLTDAGEMLAARATALLNEVAETERELRAYGTGAAGRIRLGATRTVGGYAVVPILAHFCAGQPAIEVQMRIDNTRAVEVLLIEREIDLAVVEWTVSSPDLVVEPLKTDRLLLVAPPDHRLVRSGAVTRVDLRGEAFIVREPGSGTRALAEAALGPVAAEIRNVLVLDQPEAIARAVEAGMGLAFISETIVARHLADGLLVALDFREASLEREFSLVSLRDRLWTPAMRLFAEFLRREWKGDDHSPTPDGIFHGPEPLDGRRRDIAGPSRPTRRRSRGIARQF